MRKLEKIIISAFVIALVGGIVIFAYAKKQYENIQIQQENMQIQQEGEHLLQQAIQNIKVRNYENALNLLGKLPSEFSSEQFTKRELSDLYTYLEVRTTYDPNSLVLVRNAQKQLEHLFSGTFSNISTDFCDEVATFKRDLSEQCNYLMGIEYEGIVPCVGMDEDSLYATEWGIPFKIVERKLITDIETYYFYRVDGKVYLVLVRRWRRSTEGAVENVYLVYKKSDEEFGLINMKYLEK